MNNVITKNPLTDPDKNVHIGGGESILTRDVTCKSFADDRLTDFGTFGERSSV